MHNAEEFKKEMEQIILPGSTIGVHGMEIRDDNKLVDQLSSIFFDGIHTNYGNGLASNVALYGTTDDWGYKQIYDYVYYDTEKYIVNLIIAIPETIVDSNGDNYLVCLGDAGDYRKNFGMQNYNKDVTTNWLNNYFSAKKNLPSKFIVGAMIFDIDEEKNIFVSNPYYYGNLSIDEQSKYSDYLLNDILKINCSLGCFLKISDNNLVTIRKEVDEKALFKTIASVELSDKNKAIDFINNSIDLYENHRMNSFYLKQVRKYLEKMYVK